MTSQHNAMEATAARTVPCPPPPRGCAAVAGQPCTRKNTLTGEREPIHGPGHPARITAAENAHNQKEPTQ